MRAASSVAVGVLALAFSTRADDAGPTEASARPVMRSLPPDSVRAAPPSARDLVDARMRLRQRHGELLLRSRSIPGAALASQVLVEDAAVEEDRALKWVLLEEARRQGVKAGEAPLIARAIAMASATYAFDALDVEQRSLAEMPLRGLSRQQAAAVAEAAEKLASRAEADRRLPLAASAQAIACRAWQRAGLVEPARKAEARLEELTRD